MARRVGWWSAYRAYLKSETWRDKRKELYKERDGRCEDCGHELHGRYHAHHLNYAHVGNEPLRDLSLLCESCHQKHHPRKRVGRRKRRGAVWVVCAGLLLLSILVVVVF